MNEHGSSTRLMTVSGGDGARTSGAGGPDARGARGPAVRARGKPRRKS